MSILADQIEAYIMQKLLEEEERQIILRRKELADLLNCAPSQITYVLTTRFSEEQGYEVESRRGLGGYIRITQRKPLQEQSFRIRTVAPFGRNVMEVRLRNVLAELFEERR